MVNLRNVDAQLEAVGHKNKFFGRPEVAELCHILAPNEVIQHAVMGKYEGGFALLIATDHRILLIDKKPWFLTMEDICYDLISEIDFYSRLIDATALIVSINKQLSFISLRKSRLRELVRYVQHRVMGIRNHLEQVEANNNIGARQFGNPLPESTSIVSVSNIDGRKERVAKDLVDLKSAKDFVSDYQEKIRRNSLANVAGKIMTDGFMRSKPIIRPLYPRPSLTAHYRKGTI